jgi:hypothetical protein
LQPLHKRPLTSILSPLREARKKKAGVGASFFSLALLRRERARVRVVRFAVAAVYDRCKL